MGHSTIDIPVKYLMPAAKEDFIRWVYDLPCTLSVKRYLLATWKRSTNVHLYTIDYSIALVPDNLVPPHAP